MSSSQHKRESDFKEYLLKRNPSEKFVKTYFVYLGSNVVRYYISKYSKADSIFSIVDDSILEEIYNDVKKDDNNIRLHNVYSGAISAYRKFLDGKELRTIVKKQYNVH